MDVSPTATRGDMIVAEPQRDLCIAALVAGDEAGADTATEMYLERSHVIQVPHWNSQY